MTSNVDAIFDLAADADAPNPTTSETPAPAAEVNAEATSPAVGTEESTDLYPNVLRTLLASELTDGANPDGTLTATEFASHLTVQNILAGAREEGVVAVANVYTGSKAKRNPLPVVLVFPDEATREANDQAKAKLFLPVAEASEAYKARPERGTGNGAASKRSEEELLTGAAKKFLSLTAIQTRFDRAKAQLDEGKAQLAKYKNWLRVYSKDADDPDAAVDERIAAEAERLELEADAAKNADIPDVAPATTNA